MDADAALAMSPAWQGLSRRLDRKRRGGVFPQGRRHPGSPANRGSERRLAQEADFQGCVEKHRWPSGSPITRRVPRQALVCPARQSAGLAQRYTQAGATDNSKEMRIGSLESLVQADAIA
jgi:hypothetical protein